MFKKELKQANDSEQTALMLVFKHGTDIERIRKYLAAVEKAGWLDSYQTTNFNPDQSMVVIYEP